MELNIPELSLVVLIGVTGSGKSTFARTHFKPTEVISSDFCRGLVADDENDQSATADAFELLQFIAGQRLAAGRLTVIDATNVQPEARRELVALAREHDVLPAAIVLDLPEKLCAERNAAQRRTGTSAARAPHGSAASSAAGCAAWPREGSAPCTCCTRPRRSARRDHPQDQAVQRPAARVAGRSTSSATCTAAGPNSRSCWRRSATTIDRDPAGRPANARHPAVGAPYSPATWSTAARTRRACCAWSWAWSRPGPRSAWSRQPRGKLLEALRGKNVKRSHGLDASTGAAGRPDRGVPRRRGAVHRRPDQPLRAGRRPPGGGARRADRALPRAAPRAGSASSACTGRPPARTDEYGLPVRYPWATEYRGRADGGVRPHADTGRRSG